MPHFTDYRRPAVQPRQHIIRRILRHILADERRESVIGGFVIEHREQPRLVFVPTRFDLRDLAAVLFQYVVRHRKIYAVQLILVPVGKHSVGAVLRRYHLQIQRFQIRDFARQRRGGVCVRAVPRGITFVCIRSAAAVVFRKAVTLINQFHARQIVTPRIAVHPFRHCLPVRALVILHAEFVKQIFIIARGLIAEFQIEILIVVGAALCVIPHGELRHVQRRNGIDLTPCRVIEIQIHGIISAHISGVTVTIFDQRHKLHATVFVVRVIGQIERVPVFVLRTLQIVQHVDEIKLAFGFRARHVRLRSQRAEHEDKSEQYSKYSFHARPSLKDYVRRIYADRRLVRYTEVYKYVFPVRKPDGHDPEIRIFRQFIGQRDRFAAVLFRKHRRK